MQVSPGEVSPGAATQVGPGEGLAAMHAATQVSPAVATDA